MSPPAAHTSASSGRLARRLSLKGFLVTAVGATLAALR